MARYLSIVEKAYRATIEEQDDTCLWFTHALKNGGADVAVLLRGDAVNYAVRGQSARGLRFGTRELHVAPDLERDVEALVAKEVPVWVVRDDVLERGIEPDRLVAGVEAISRGGLGKLVDSFERVFHW